MSSTQRAGNTKGPINRQEGIKWKLLWLTSIPIQTRKQYNSTWKKYKSRQICSEVKKGCDTKMGEKKKKHRLYIGDRGDQAHYTGILLITKFVYQLVCVKSIKLRCHGKWNCCISQLLFLKKIILILLINNNHNHNHTNNF